MRSCPKCQRTYPDEMGYCSRDATALISVDSATQAELESSLAQRFRIVRRLGGGGMGVVFLAEQIAVGNRPVALKVLLRKLLDDPEFLVRFRNEAASTGRIDHPNVVTIFESGQADDGTPYIAMQYLEGESLRARLNARGDSFYENGDYDNAIRAYQEGLRVDPGNRELKLKVQKARSAKAAEESLGKQ